MSHKTISSLLLSLAILALPAAAWFEKTERKVWENRLIIPELIYEPHRHTPLITNGTYLPSSLNKDTVFTLEHSPLILTKKTRIAPGTTVTLNPGIAVYAHEFSGLEVEGALIANGTPDAQIVFASNEQHPLNQTWNGIAFAAGSLGQISHARIKQSDPAITCGEGSRVTIDTSELNSHSLAAFIASNNCSLLASTIKSQHGGINIVNAQPYLNNNTFKTKQHTVQQYTAP